MITKVMYFLILLAEIFNIKKGCKNWSYCYSFGKIYMYSDFLLKDKPKISFIDLFWMYILCSFFYFVLLTQVFIMLFFIVINIFFNIRLSKKSYVFNIFIYIPFLMSKSLNVLMKNMSKKLVLTLIINFINIYMWGFPRIVFNYAYISFGIIKSFEKDPEEFDIKKILEILDYVYNNTWCVTINKLEKINTL